MKKLLINVGLNLILCILNYEAAVLSKYNKINLIKKRQFYEDYVHPEHEHFGHHEHSMVKLEYIPVPVPNAVRTNEGDRFPFQPHQRLKTESLKTTEIRNITYTTTIKQNDSIVSYTNMLSSQIKPAFLQSTWFIVIMVLIALTILALLIAFCCIKRSRNSNEATKSNSEKSLVDETQTEIEDDKKPSQEKEPKKEVEQEGKKIESSQKDSN